MQGFFYDAIGRDEKNSQKVYIYVLGEVFIIKGFKEGGIYILFGMKNLYVKLIIFYEARITLL